MKKDFPKIHFFKKNNFHKKFERNTFLKFFKLERCFFTLF